MMIKRLSLLLLFLFIFLLFIHDIQSHDIWWHLKAGQDILQSHTVAHVDAYSYVSAGRPWFDMHWLFQVLVFLVYTQYGVGGLIFFKSCILVTVFIILFKALSGFGNSGITAAVIGLSALCIWERGLLRPEILSFLYLSIFLYILHRYKYIGGFNKKLLYVLPLAQLFWVNSHALFILGIVLVGSYVAGEFIAARIQAPVFNDIRYRMSPKDYSRLLTVAVLVVGVSFINPYTYQGFLFPFTLLSRINGGNQIFSTIGEFQPPFSAYCQNSTILYYKIMLALAAFSIAMNVRRVSLSHVFSYMIFFCLSLLARRNIPLFALVCVPIIVVNMRQIIEHRAKKFFERADVRLAGSCALIFVVSLGIVDLSEGGERIRGDNERSFHLGAAPFKFPVNAADFIEKTGIQGNMFNDLQSGNYLIWRFCPQRKVFLDGRLEVHSERFFTEYVRLLEAPRLWPEMSRKYALTYALFPHTDADFDQLLLYLYQDSQWSLVYFDDAFVVFVKNSAENQEVINTYRVDMSAADFTTMNLRERFSKKFLSKIYFQRGNFFARLSCFDKAKENYIHALVYKYYNEKIYTNLGIIYAKEHDFAAAFSAYRMALDIDPYSAAAYFNLGTLYRFQGNIPAALKCYHDSVRCGGGLNGAYYNLAGICFAYGNYGEAEKWYRALLKARPWNIGARANLGAVYAVQGYYDKARKEFLKVLEASPHDPVAAKNLELLTKKMRL